MNIKPEQHEAIYGLAKAIKQELDSIDDAILEQKIEELTPLLGLVEALVIVIDNIEG